MMKDLIENINKDVRSLIYLEIHKFKLKKVNAELMEHFKMKELYAMSISYNALRLMLGFGGLQYSN